MLGLVFIVEALGDYLSCMWHHAREHERIALQAGIAMVLQALTWVPVWLAIQTEDWRIALVSVIGTGVGTILGALRVKNREAKIKTAAIPAVTPRSAPSLENILRQ